MTIAGSQDPSAAIEALFGDVSESRLRAAYLEAIAAWQAEAPSEDTIILHGTVGRFLVDALIAASKTPGSHDGFDVSWLTGFASSPALRLLADCNWWLVRTGIAVPIDFDFVNGGAPRQMRQTSVGKRALARWPDHPLADGYLDRLQARCPELPESILTLLADARACLDHGLARPALVLLGAAYEEAVLGVVLRLSRADKLGGATVDSVEQMKAWRRIDLLRASLEKVPHGDRDHAGLAACRFADELRNRRNDAAHTHPNHPFDDAGEIEEFVVSAGRHLPALWSIR